MKPRFDPAPLDVHIVDVWPPDRLNAAVRWAYAQAADRGRIRIERIFPDPANGRTVVRYWADIPAEWIRAELGELKRKFDGVQLTIQEVQ